MMPRLRAFAARLRGLSPRHNREAEMREEIAHDLELMIEAAQARGLPYKEARRQALIQLGGMEKTMQSIRDRRTLPALEELAQDVRFATRQLQTRPGFALTAIITLVLGFAASVAIFAFVDAAMIRPLPYREPLRLAWVTELVENMGPANLSWQDYGDWKQQAQSFERFDVWRYAGYQVRSGTSLTPTPAIQVSAGFLQTLGVAPAFGRDFASGDNLPGAAKVVMLTHDVWQQQFSADPTIVNRSIEMNGDYYTVIGVLNSVFQFAPRGRVGVITAIQPVAGSCEVRRSCHALNGVARLRPGVSFAQADADVRRIAATLQTQYPDSNRGQGAIVQPLAEEVVGKIRPVLYTLLTAALLLSVIACINVASLLLARSESRRREFALRAALGATNTRMLRQFAVESALLVSTGIVCGAFVASGSIRLLMLLVPDVMRNRMPFFSAVGLNAHTFVFALGEAVLAALLFTLVPALRSRMSSLQRAMAEGSAGAGSLSWRRLGSLLVIAEVATAVVLLAGAGMLTRSVVNLLHTELYFDSDHLVTLGIGLPKKYATGPEQITAERQVVNHLRALPGVISAGFGAELPLSGNGNTDWIRFPDRPYDGKHIEINGRAATPGYLSTLRVPLLRGRFFTDDDNAGKPLVAIVNRRFAETYFPGQNPIGKTFGNTALEAKSMKTIVGVIENLQEGALDEAVWPAAYYAPYQDPSEVAQIVLRTAGDERTVLASIPDAIRSVDPDIGVSDLMTMNDRIQSSQSAILHRGAAWLAGAFAILALILCAVGLYGVVSYSVSLRTREIGLRMALGAPRHSIYSLVFKEAGRLSLAGIAIGIALAMASSSLLRSLLFHVPKYDAPTLGAVSVLLTLCSVAACLLPARRAALASPVEALRTD